MDERVVYLLKRTASLFIAIFLVASTIFVFMFVTNGDPFDTLVPRTGDESLRQRIVDDLMLNEPIPAQYVNFMKKMFTGQFFTSTGVMKFADIHDFIFDALAYTFLLLIPILMFSAAIGVVLEMPFRRGAGGLLDRLFQVLMAFLFCLPVVAIGQVVLYLNGPQHLPVNGNGLFPETDGDQSRFVSYLEHAILPILAGVVSAFACFCIAFRSTFSGGSAPGAIPSRMPGVATTKFLLPWIISIVLIIDTVFGYGGLGDLLWNSISMRDIPTLMVCVFLIGVVAAFSSYILDIMVMAERSLTGRAKRAPSSQTTASAAIPLRTPAPEQHGPILFGLLGSKTGIVALGILLLILVMAIASPWISTVANPNSSQNFEPNLMPGDPLLLPEHTIWRNPHPPSLGESPYTGFLHPLGTDSVGRDVYSMLLYGAIDGMLVIGLMIGASILAGFLVWVFASALAGYKDIFSRLMEFVGLTAAEFILAMPFFVFGTLMLVTARETWAQSLIPLSFVALAFSFVLPTFYFRARLSALDKKLSDGGEPHDQRLSSWRYKNMFGGRMWVEVLHTAKITTVVGFMSIMIIEFLGLMNPETISWGSMLEGAYASAGFLMEHWWTFVPTGFAMIVLPWSAYLLMDKLEQLLSRQLPSE